MKKAQSQYISWILILGMIVAISFALYNWSIQQAKETGEELQLRTDPLVCAEVSFAVEGICQSFATIEMNVTNTNNLDIEGFVLRTVGLYPEDDNYINQIEEDHKVFTGDTEKIVVLKKGTLSQAKIVPFATKGKKKIYCEDKSITREDIKQC